VAALETGTRVYVVGTPPRAGGQHWDRFAALAGCAAVPGVTEDAGSPFSVLGVIP
jgi:hypothetical protein